jgi:hypothetical protein
VAYQGFQNLTPFAAEPFLLADEEGAALLTLVAKGTYDLPPRGGLEIAPEQVPIHKVPVHHGEPGESSLRFEHETAFAKVVADIVLLGHAQPERGRATELDVTLRVGPLRKQVRVFGDRSWRRGVGGPVCSEPASFEKMPLVYERAFGGYDRSAPDPAQHACDPRNPVGVGFLVPRPQTPAPPQASAGLAGDDVKLPNLEDPAALICDAQDHPAPAGFGFIAPDWSPRRQLAGTFDDAWKAGRFPRLPADFNRRHFNAAPADQQMSVLRGGEPVEVVGVSHRGPLRFELPRLALEAVVMLRGGERRAAPMPLDTLIVDADAHRVHLVFRASFGLHRRAYDLEWSKVQIKEGAARG